MEKKRDWSRDIRSDAETERERREGWLGTQWMETRGERKMRRMRKKL